MVKAIPFLVIRRIAQPEIGAQIDNLDRAAIARPAAGSGHGAARKDVDAGKVDLSILTSGGSCRCADAGTPRRQDCPAFRSADSAATSICGWVAKDADQFGAGIPRPQEWQLSASYPVSDG